jgi:hypothetical protein
MLIIQRGATIVAKPPSVEMKQSILDINDPQWLEPGRAFVGSRKSQGWITGTST